MASDMVRYEINSTPVIVFIKDRMIHLPRFQRKITWDEKDNFYLTISVFKQFPLGAIVINKEKEDRQITKWLLDGRQRKNAFTKMLEDPEVIYTWARRVCGFNNNHQPYEIEEKFWKKVNDYLGSKSWEDLEREEDSSRNDSENIDPLEQERDS